jgi:hypothetical protein
MSQIRITTAEGCKGPGRAQIRGWPAECTCPPLQPKRDCNRRTTSAGETASAFGEELEVRTGTRPITTIPSAASTHLILLIYPAFRREPGQPLLPSMPASGRRGTHQVIRPPPLTVDARGLVARIREALSWRGQRNTDVSAEADCANFHKPLPAQARDTATVRDS